jgi:hypothetical protein
MDTTARLSIGLNRERIAAKLQHKTTLTFIIKIVRALIKG